MNSKQKIKLLAIIILAFLVKMRYIGTKAWECVWAIKEADFHIILKCKGKCPYCYVDLQHATETIFNNCQTNVCTLRNALKIITKLRFVAGAQDLVFVGGDPCLHPNLAEMIIFAKLIGLNTCILSNTHRYMMAGEEIDLQKVMPYIDELDFTLHGLPADHNAFNQMPGSYEKAFEQLRAFRDGRTEEQAIGIVLNMVPSTIGTPSYLRGMMAGAISRLGLVPGLDFFTIQRIAFKGAGSIDCQKWRITPEMLSGAFDIFDRIAKSYEIETKCCIDTVPWCALPERHWHYLEPLMGGCNWGKPGGVLSIMPDGNIQRCALCSKHLGVNIAEMKDYSGFAEFMQTNPTLVAVKEHKHLSDKCLKCSLLNQCGGGCIVANTSDGGICDPYSCGSDNVPRGMDYLAPGFND